ncbi:MAG: ferritin-like domain-containing protein [Acidobacteriota bacterium]
MSVRTSGQWHEHYVRNAARRPEIPWQEGEGQAALTAAEKRAIGSSLQAWQLGETSDGSHLLAAAGRYARQQQDPLFLEVVRWFIREEQRHGSELGKFLDQAGIPRIHRNWGDTLFRAIRYSVPSMEVWASVVIMVETLALIYYRALRDATRSPVLRHICQQILRDEVHHIRFQYERLAILLRRRPRFLLRLTFGLQRLLFGGTTLAVWAGHRRVLRAGGFTFGSFWKSAWLRMEFAWRRMDPARYRWAETEAGHEATAALAID